jgi:hypothetical protein
MVQAVRLSFQAMSAVSMESRCPKGVIRDRVLKITVSPSTGIYTTGRVAAIQATTTVVATPSKIELATRSLIRRIARMRAGVAVEAGEGSAGIGIARESTYLTGNSHSTPGL